MIGGERSGVKVRETEAFIARAPNTQLDSKLCASEGHAISAALGWCEQAAKERRTLTAYVDAPDGDTIHTLRSMGDGTVVITEGAGRVEPIV